MEDGSRAIKQEVCLWKHLLETAFPDMGGVINLVTWGISLYGRAGMV